MHHTLYFPLLQQKIEIVVHRWCFCALLSTQVCKDCDCCLLMYVCVCVFAAGSVEWKRLMGEFYEPFDNAIQQANNYSTTQVRTAIVYHTQRECDLII